MSENTPESKTQNIPDSAADALAANTNTSGRLNGNEAVNMAAEAWKDAAGQNIPAFKFADEPLESDTANLRQGPSLNDALLGLLPLVGVWQGEGEAHDSAGKQFHFGQQLVVAHDGGEYLTFSSRTWKIDSEGTAGEPYVRETGFWRISAKDEIEVTYTSSNGIVEIFYGEVFNERAWQLQSASTMVTETGPKNLGPGKRMYGLMPNNNLGWVDERLVDDEMRPYMSAELRRVAG
ncbi:FABP family protein [Corynebacterium stationis]|uniref:FABP family protein n=1 Tax=Corynebacterium stationis TaxID=1705 RepID=UPI000ECB8713|nr:FABP family protein [Corynebacterium stationis]HCM80476.1 FABP family protein [Corynebacterium stationis]